MRHETPSASASRPILIRSAAGTTFPPSGARCPGYTEPRSARHRAARRPIPDDTEPLARPALLCRPGFDVAGAFCPGPAARNPLPPLLPSRFSSAPPPARRSRRPGQDAPATPSRGQAASSRKAIHPRRHRTARTTRDLVSPGAWCSRGILPRSCGAQPLPPLLPSRFSSAPPRSAVPNQPRYAPGEDGKLARDIGGRDCDPGKYSRANLRNRCVETRRPMPSRSQPIFFEW